MYDWNFGRLVAFKYAFVQGVETTLLLTAIIIVFGTILGCIIGFALQKRWIYILLYPVIDLLRSLPPLVLLLFFYYLLTQQVVGFTLPSYWVTVLALTLNLAAFTSDLVRAAYQNVPQSSIDAGRALAFPRKQLFLRIVLPHVVREVTPGMAALCIGVLKLTSLASVINVRETTFVAQTVIASVSRSLEAWTIVGIIYAVLVIPASYGIRKLERVLWS